MKLYIKRNNLQLELIRYHKNVDFIHISFCEAMDSMTTELKSGGFEPGLFRTQITSPPFPTVEPSGCMASLFKSNLKTLKRSYVESHLTEFLYYLLSLSLRISFSIKQTSSFDIRFSLKS